MELAEHFESLADLEIPPECIHWEMCFAEEGKDESDVLKRKQTCEKCQGNIFIAMKNLTLDHLPSDSCDESTLKWINHIAELTVKIKILCRPTKSSKLRRAFNGTGFVVAVKDIDPNGADDSQRNSEITIFTAEHIIHSDLVEKIDVLFFYDGQKDSKELKGGELTTDLQKDFCQLSCLSNDQQFVCQLRDHLKSIKEISNESPSSTNLSFIVSHPHGVEKQVSFGTWWQENVELNDQSYPHKITRLGDSLYGVYRNTVLYDIPTCRGSSGARVMLFGYKNYEYSYHLGSLNDKIGMSAYSLKRVEMHEITRQPMESQFAWHVGADLPFIRVKSGSS